jgi:hypothetical protein
MAQLEPTSTPRKEGRTVPVGLIVVSVLLAVQALFALRAGRITSAGICLGALGWAGMTLRNWYRKHGRAVPGTTAGQPLAAPLAAPGSALVAFVYPDQIDRFGELFAAVDLASQDVNVLAIDPSTCSSETGSAATFFSAESILRERDPRLVGVLARAAASAARPVALIRAAGLDPAAVVLDAALRLRASRVVVLRADDTSPAEQRRFCVTAWESLPSPRPALRVDLIAAGCAPLTLELVPDGAPRTWAP